MSTKNILKSIISFFIIVASLNCSSQDRKIYELEKRMQFSIISDYHETGDFSRTSAILLSYCKNVKKMPVTPEDILTFCVTAGYHPNEMIIDDIGLDQMRIMNDYNGMLVLYFIGPDVHDDTLSIKFHHNSYNMSFTEYLNLKGDFILGEIDINDASFYVNQ